MYIVALIIVGVFVGAAWLYLAAYYAKIDLQDEEDGEVIE